MENKTTLRKIPPEILITQSLKFIVIITSKGRGKRTKTHAKSPSKLK